MDDVRLICSFCGDVIGIYEPCLRRQANGVEERTAWMREQERPADEEREYFHLNCESLLQAAGSG